MHVCKYVSIDTLQTHIRRHICMCHVTKNTPVQAPVQSRETRPGEMFNHTCVFLNKRVVYVCNEYEIYKSKHPCGHTTAVKMRRLNAMHYRHVRCCDGAVHIYKASKSFVNTRLKNAKHERINSSAFLIHTLPLIDSNSCECESLSLPLCPSHPLAPVFQKFTMRQTISSFRAVGLLSKRMNEKVWGAGVLTCPPLCLV